MPVTINGTTGIIAPDGTSINPVYRGSNSNSGIFYTSTGNVGITIAGTQRMLIDSTGNVSVSGTINAAAVLVNGTALASAVTSLTAGNGITVSGSTGAVTVSQDIYTGSAGNNTSFPIGTYVGCYTDAQTVLNSSVAPRLQSATAGANYVYTIGGSASALTGTWRVRTGTTNSCGGLCLLQRTA